MSAKIRKITVFFMFFKIEMTFMLKSKSEKIFHFARVVFVILDFEEGRTRNYQKTR